MPSQEYWIVRAAKLFPASLPDHIRTSDIPLVLICLDIDDEDMSIRRALGVGRVREIPIANLVRVLSSFLPAENSASERLAMFRSFDEYNEGAVGLHDLQRIAVGAGLLSPDECERIMAVLANTGNGITFDHWCTLLKDEAINDAAAAETAAAPATAAAPPSASDSSGGAPMTPEDAAVIVGRARTRSALEIAVAGAPELLGARVRGQSMIGSAAFVKSVAAQAAAMQTQA
jgi:hypothetical protein